MTTMHPVHKMCLPTLAMVLALVLLPKVPLASGHRLSLKSISLKVGDCSNCGMGVLGQLSIKVSQRSQPGLHALFGARALCLKGGLYSSTFTGLRKRIQTLLPRPSH